MSGPFNNRNTIGAGQNRDVGKRDEKPVFDDAGNGRQSAGKRNRIGNPCERSVQNEVTTVRDESKAVFAHPQAARTGHSGRGDRPLDRLLRRRKAEGNDLDRQRKPSERTNVLGAVGDDNHAGGGRCNDLLAQQSPPAALDQDEVGADLVGAVDRQIEFRRVIERRQRNAQAFGLCAGRFRGRDAYDREPAPHPFGQQIDELLRGRPRAEPQAHAGAHVFQGLSGRLPLLRFGVHGLLRLSLDQVAEPVQRRRDRPRACPRPNPRLAMRVPSPPVIVFDLDGTLVDTAPDLIATLNSVFADGGLPPVPADEARAMIGAGVKPLIERGLVAEGVRFTSAELDQLYKIYLDRYAAHIADLSRPFPGVEAALDVLAGEGYRFAVCTNKLEWLSVRLLDALGLSARFDAICGQDTFGTPKPDPEMLRKTIRRAGGDPASAIMVGDSATDIETARAAGIPVVAVDFGYTEIPISELGPDRVISHFDQLPDAVRALRVKSSI